VKNKIILLSAEDAEDSKKTALFCAGKVKEAIEECQERFGRKVYYLLAKRPFLFK
jgi:hypothetical protein